MADLNKESDTKNLQLSSWDDFANDMADVAKRFDEPLREYVLLALWHNASFWAWLEDMRDKERLRARLLRRERIHADRMRRHIKNAIVSLNKVGTGRGLESLGKNYVRDASRLLEMAVEDFLFLDDLLRALIHPALRTAKEKGQKVQSAEMGQWSIFPGFGKAKIDQMFIAWMDRYLRGLVTSDGSRLSSAEINRIIVATMKAAFHRHLTEEAIRTARLRLSQQHP